MSAVYVFALVDAKTAPLHVAGHEIEFLDVAGADGIYAAVERVDARPAPSEETLRAQHDVVVAIARHVDAVLPARFGSLVDRGELERVVTLRRGVILESLDLVRGRVQMTARLFDSRPDNAGTEVAAAPPRATSGTGYLQQRWHAAALRARPDGILDFTAALAGIAVAERFEAGRGALATTVYHLIDRGGVGKYNRALERIRSRLVPRRLTISGPWPPFAFVPDLF
jgi:hypothetical protein